MFVVSSKRKIITFSMRNLAASSTLVFSLAEMLNQPANPFSFEKASRAAVLAAAPDAGWSHLLPSSTQGMGRPSGRRTCTGKTSVLNFHFLIWERPAGFCLQV